MVDQCVNYDPWLWTNRRKRVCAAFLVHFKRRTGWYFIWTLLRIGKGDGMESKREGLVAKKCESEFKAFHAVDVQLMSKHNSFQGNNSLYPFCIKEKGKETNFYSQVTQGTWVKIDCWRNYERCTDTKTNPGIKINRLSIVNKTGSTRKPLMFLISQIYSNKWTQTKYKIQTKR